jgi:hypothetical protein
MGELIRSGVLPFAFCVLASRAQASSALPGFTGALTTPTAFSQAFQSGATGLNRFQGQTRGFLNYGAWESGELTLSTAGTDLRVHAKYTLLGESPRTPALAIGGTGFLGHHPSLYAVAGGNVRVRDEGPQLRLAGGVATRGVLPPLFFSAEVRVSRVAGLMAEWSRSFNVGLRVHPSAQFRVMFGVVHHRAGLGVNYDIGL